MGISSAVAAALCILACICSLQAVAMGKHTTGLACGSVLVYS